MSEQASHKCNCDGSKKLKSLEKEMVEIKAILEKVVKDIDILRRAVRK